MGMSAEILDMWHSVQHVSTRMLVDFAILYNIDLKKS